MKYKMKSKSGLIIFIFCLILTSCVSIKENKDVPVPIDYSDAEVVSNEKKRIAQLKEEQPVKALWRALLLGEDVVIEDTKALVYEKLEEAYEEKDFFLVQKYFTSLKTIGYEFSEEEIARYASAVYTNVPGLNSNNDFAPSNMKECLDATVTIWVDKGIKVENGAGMADIVIGSGFFIDKAGYIVTNHHVIESMVNPKYEGYSRLFIKLLNNPDEKIPAKVIGYDSILDLALLKAEVEPEFVLSLGSSKDIVVGDKISAIGAPLGLEGTVTSGIVSTVDRKMTTFGNVFQIDAAINSGNSGGPIVDADMKVQAIVFAGILKFQGLNFAIPVEYLIKELPGLYNGQEGDEFIHSWIGCYGHTKRAGNSKEGLEIQYVMPGSSASFSGLKAGDTIKEIDGNPINRIEDLHYIFMAYQNETMLSCKYIDETEMERNCFIYLEKRPVKPFVQISKSDFLYNTFMPAFGMKLIPSSTTSKNTYKIESIIKNSTADQLSFSENDLVQIKDTKLDVENGSFYAIINTERQKKGCLDLIMSLGSSLDSPYYF